MQIKQPSSVGRKPAPDTFLQGKAEIPGLKDFPGGRCQRAFFPLTDEGASQYLLFDFTFLTSFTISYISLTSAGLVRQQPPITLAPAAIHFLT